MGDAHDGSTRTRRRWSTWWMILAVGALAAAACSGDDDAAADPDTSSTAVEDGAAGNGADVAADGDPIVEPRILCRSDDGITFLTYSNSGAATRVITVGPANQVTDANGDVVEGNGRPIVFAPGEHDFVAFWVATGSTWTLGVGDGARAVETGDDAGPACSADRGPDATDTRAGDVVSSVEVERADDGTLTSATVTLDYDGLGESRCPAGPVEWEPAPAEVVFSRWLFDDRGTGDGAVVERRSPLVFEVRDPLNEPTGGFDDLKAHRSLDLYVDATDVCVDADGNRHTAWIASADVLDDGFLSEKVCFGVIESAPGDDYAEVDCRQLPATDGIRIRLP